jgi:hypothetical protein
MRVGLELKKIKASKLDKLDERSSYGQMRAQI